MAINAKSSPQSTMNGTVNQKQNPIYDPKITVSINKERICKLLHSPIVITRLASFGWCLPSTRGPRFMVRHHLKVDSFSFIYSIHFVTGAKDRWECKKFATAGYKSQRGAVWSASAVARCNCQASFVSILPRTLVESSHGCCVWTPFEAACSAPAAHFIACHHSRSLEAHLVLLPKWINYQLIGESIHHSIQQIRLP